MVRMCDVMTLACATVMAAGTVATAQNKAAAPAQPVAATTNPGSFAQVVGNNLSGLVTRGISNGCSCPNGANSWWNGEWDGLDGQASHEGGGAPAGATAADDFFLCEGYVHTLRSISVTVLNNSAFNLTRARLEIWSDCNGCPGTLLYVLNKHGVETQQTDINGGGFNEYIYTFELDNVPHVGGPFAGFVQQGSCPGETVSTNPPCLPDPDCFRYIALKGGVYWLSVVGKTDGQGTDLTFWATTSDDTEVYNDIKGSVAKKRDGTAVPMNWGDPFTYGDWRSVEECCVGCTDLAFRVCFDSCKILKDNGSDLGGDTGGAAGVNEEGARSERSGLVRNSRAADDFVVPPCADFEVCYVEGCIYTNCPEFTGFFEIYANDCKLPYYELDGTPGAVCADYTHTKRVCLGYDVAIDGVNDLIAYRVEFHDVTGCTLASGQQYWISIGVQDTFSFIERGYFCRNSYCEAPCEGDRTIMFNPGAVLDPAANYWTSGITEWRSTADFLDRWSPVGTDFSFLIAGEAVQPATGPNAEPACVGDADGNSVIEVADIFFFLSAWFAGCP